MQVVRKKKKVSVLSDSEDDTIVEDKKDSKPSNASKKNKCEKPAIPLGELFGKRPITRIEGTKVSQKLQKVVNIIFKYKQRD